MFLVRNKKNNIYYIHVLLSGGLCHPMEIGTWVKVQNKNVQNVYKNVKVQSLNGQTSTTVKLTQKINQRSYYNLPHSAFSFWVGDTDNSGLYQEFQIAKNSLFD